MKTKIALFLSLLLTLVALPALAQSQLTLTLTRDFGYGGGNDIQGTFSMHVKGPEDLQKVTFYIDEQAIGEDATAPFALRFVTDNYPLTEHRLKAVGVLPNGEQVTSNIIIVNFVSAEEGWQAGLKIAGPLLALTLIALLVSFVPTMLPNNKLKNLAPGTERSYGLVGGTICKRCARPYPRSVMSPNLVTGKLTRCPFCGKVQISRAYPIEMLRAAEAAEIKDAAAGQVQDISEEDKLRREIDESRYL
jgi:hypothetical protein